VEIPRGRGFIKDPLGTEIPKGWGDANQKPSVVGVWIFSGTTHYHKPQQNKFVAANCQLAFQTCFINYNRLLDIIT